MSPTINASKPMIDIAPEKYWIECTLEEAVLYCFSLTIDDKIGWRLPTQMESYFNSTLWKGWHQSDHSTTKVYWAIPVRDIDI